MPEVQPHPPIHRYRRLVVLCLVLGAAIPFVMRSVGQRPTVLKTPDPNGYDDLVAAGSMIVGDWPNGGDLAKADIIPLRGFVESNRPALDRTRVGLGREVLVTIEKTPEAVGRQFVTIGRIKNLSRLLLAEARVSEDDRRFADARKSYLDLLNLGQSLTIGGAAIEAVMGWSIQEQALQRLVAIRDQFSTDECRTLIRDLDTLGKKRASLDDLDSEWGRRYVASTGPVQRTMMSWSGMEKTGRANEKAMARKGRDRVDRAMGFCRVGLAIKAYHREIGTWPRSTGELVPDFLDAVPTDPTTGKPLDYPAGPSGELTDDLSAIARPDGAVTPPPP